MDLEDLPLFQNQNQGQNQGQNRPKHWTVTELTSRIKGTLEPTFSEVWLQGEVSNAKPTGPSGHAYFSLKDAGSMISAVYFGWGKAKRAFDLKDGLQVLCRGKISVYAPRGNYQIVLDQIEPQGAGALQLAFEQLKQKLQADGLFDLKRKRTLPPFPKKIAVVTSPSGAAIRDMLNILKRRAPHIEVLVIPALVQGEEAPAQILRGLEAANRYKLGEIIVLARGGGSIEDLWGFNDETLARAIARSEVPVISAVGHEVDFTIADFVADLRAPTPSAAAEIISGNWVDVSRDLRQNFDRIRNAIVRDLVNRRTMLGHLSARLVNPLDRIREQMQRCDELMNRMERAILGTFERKKLALAQWAGKLEALSPLKVLERGYSILRKENGTVVRSPKDVERSEKVTVTLHEGQVQAQIL